MNEERLRNLARCLHNKKISTLDSEDVIDKFSIVEARKRNLTI